MGFEEEINTLSQLGLTVCEARVYLALASSGMCSAKKISKISNMSSPDVYRVLGRLQERGIIEKVISYPAIFKAVPMEKTLSILFQHKEKEFNALKERTDRLLCSYKNREKTESYRDEEHQFIIIPTKGAEIEKRRHLLEIAHQSMDVINSWKRFSKTLFEFADDDIKALQRGVKIRTITEKPTVKRLPKLIRDVINAGSFEIKYLPYPPLAVMTIYDKKTALLTTSSLAGLGETTVLCTSNIPLLAVMQEYFEVLWSQAEYHPKFC